MTNGEHELYLKVQQFNTEVRKTKTPAKPAALTYGTQKDRFDFMQEELGEFMIATTVEDQLDALVDLHYFLLGTVQAMGVSSSQYNAAFNMVHEANMKKAAGKKPGRNTVTVDAYKPSDWVAPDLSVLFDK